MKKLCMIILALLLVLSGCSGHAKSPYVPTGDGLQQGSDPTRPTASAGTAVEYALVYRPDKPLNPLLATDYTNRVLLGLIYQSLFAIDRENNAHPILCDTYNVSSDMKTYTFYLAQAFFSDGTAVTAADAVASLQAAQTGWYAGRLQQVRAISAYGNAVVIELLTPMENLPLLLDIPIIKASEVTAANPVGSGPYRLDETNQVLRRQAAWWCDAALPVNADTIRLVKAGTPGEVRDAFEQAGVSMVCTDPGNAGQVDFRGDYELWDCDNGQFLFLGCNEKSKVFADENIRKALTHAIDRATLVDAYYGGFAQAAQLPAAPASPWYNNNLAARYGYDPEKFAAAVAGATLETNEVTLLCSGADVTRLRVCNAIAKMLEEGGLKVTVLSETSSNYISRLKAGAYDLYLGETRLSRNMDLSAFFAPQGTLNYGGMADPALNAMSLEALANAGNYYNLHENVMDSGMLCPILFRSYALYTARGAFPDLAPARDNIFYYDLGRTMADAQ